MTVRTPIRPLNPVQPVAAVLDDEHLPTAVHDAAARWRALDALEASVEDDWREARGRMPGAKADDHRAALEAAEAGRPAPDPEAHQAQAAADVEAQARRLSKVREDKRAAGRELLASLVQHRDELVQLAAERVRKAADDYEKALSQARAKLAPAGHALALATQSLGVLGELDREPRLRHEVGAPAWPVAPVDTSATERHVRAIREAVEAYSAPPAQAESVERGHDNTLDHLTA